MSNIQNKVVIIMGAHTWNCSGKRNPDSSNETNYLMDVAINEIIIRPTRQLP